MLEKLTGDIFALSRVCLKRNQVTEGFLRCWLDSLGIRPIDAVMCIETTTSRDTVKQEIWFEERRKGKREKGKDVRVKACRNCEFFLRDLRVYDIHGLRSSWYVDGECRNSSSFAGRPMEGKRWVKEDEWCNFWEAK